MNHTYLPHSREHHLILSDREWHSLRGYLRRAQRKGIAPQPTLASVLSDLDILEDSNA